ncbi:hypothetical protein SAMN05428966_1176 [Massilia sp. PDC64]|nr:hypothetical protein [Massilia sp. PDC64]SDF54952.1 hypothetical protein SAMN05428966_1176 [Massilia sp. PDC64]
MKRLIPLLLACACHLAAHAADTLPAHVAGSWGTAESLQAGDTAQTVLYLQTDGYGLMAGSTPPAKRMDGVDDGKPGPRAIIGFPLRATLDGATLHLRPFSLQGAPADQAAKVANIVMTCRYDAGVPSIACEGPDKASLVLHRLGATLPPEATSTIAGLKAQQNGS